MARCPQCGWLGEDDHSDWNYVMRGENELQAVDRQFTELLQELRVAQTGVQILFAFLLGLAFTTRFTELSSAEQAVYLVTLVLSATSAALLIAPVSLVDPNMGGIALRRWTASSGGATRQQQAE